MSVGQEPARRSALAQSLWFEVCPERRSGGLEGCLAAWRLAPSGQARRETGAPETEATAFLTLSGEGGYYKNTPSFPAFS